MSATGVSGSEGGAGGKAGAGGAADTRISAADRTEPAGTRAASAGAGAPEGARTAAPEGAGGEEEAVRGRVPGPWWWPRRRSVALDVLLAFLSALECAAEGAAFAGRVGMPESIFVLLGFAAGSTLVLRRHWPVAVVLVSLAVSPAQMGVVLGIVGLYTLAASPVPRRITFSLAGLTTFGTFVVTVLDMHNDQRGQSGVHMPMLALVLTALAVAIGMTVAPLLLGLYIGARRRLVESLVDRADGLERELALLAEKASERAQLARIEERTRIAREMHDVVAHRVSLMVVHAAALQALVLRDPQKAARNAELVGNMGRQALDELRTMLGVLRANQSRANETVAAGAMAGGGTKSDARASGARAGGAPAAGHLRTAAPSGGRALAAAQVTSPAPPAGRPLPEPVGAVSAARGPQSAREEEQEAEPGSDSGFAPALGNVAELVDESRAAGMAVELSVEGEERPLRAEAGHTAYRVVQEALTNVHKHAPGAKALVRIAYRPDEIAVLVENGPSDGRPSAALPSGGNGLVGMRERVVALGGGFVAGPRDGGGFRVSAMLPDAG